MIDDNASQTCRTPCMIPLSPGRHTLSVQLAGFRPYPRVINVPQDGDIFMQLSKAAGTLSLTSEPEGATIEMDGMPQSKRTPSLFELSPGSHHFRVSRNGASLDFDVKVRDGDVITKKIDF